MQTIVVSGINLFMGGTLKVMQDCIAALSAYARQHNFRIIALVYDEKLYTPYDNVQYISFPLSRKSYFHRLYYEYIGFRKLSRQWQPELWLSLHDTTPNVIAKHRAVYCHNPFPFYRAGWKDLLLQPNIWLLSLLTRHIIYKTNIRKNDYVIVQQEWIRDAFRRMFGVKNIVVAPPHQPKKTTSTPTPLAKKRSGDKTVFLYPAGPVVHKNFETLCRAVALLETQGVDNIEVTITVSGEENKYTRQLHRKFGALRSLHFSGFLTRAEMDRLYQTADCLVFPSHVETWGLPITEAKEHGLPILISDLPYARESVGAYETVSFFKPTDTVALAQKMRAFAEGKLVYDGNTETVHHEPIVYHWEELFNLLLR
ncbi:MAG: glycosyltransferase family 4 protein [Candidatus Symbiothrix sp.]|jgi:glycosyltransferase involved in cell wall biosynthesis|nr:glycosyltransferase family 4 protein [Candidatus Symbiothrix sp.]